MRDGLYMFQVPVVTLGPNIVCALPVPIAGGRCRQHNDGAMAAVVVEFPQPGRTR